MNTQSKVGRERRQMVACKRLLAGVGVILFGSVAHADTPPGPEPGSEASMARNRPQPNEPPDQGIHLLNDKQGQVKGMLLSVDDGYAAIAVELSKNPPRVDVKRFPFSQDGLMERELPKLIGAKIQGRLVRDTRGRFHLTEYTVLEPAPVGGPLIKPTPAP